MSRFLPLALACLMLASILQPTAVAQSLSGLVPVQSVSGWVMSQAETSKPGIQIATSPALPRVKLPRVLVLNEVGKTQPPASATSADPISVTLRTAEDSYAADASWFCDVKRFLKYSQELREWNRLKESTRTRLQRKKQAEAGDKFSSPYEHLPTESEIEAEIGPPPVAVPMPAVLDLGLVLDLKNTSDDPVSVNVGLYSDLARVSTTIRGPGAVKYVSPPRITTMEIRGGHTITLASGETQSVPMNMTDGHRGFGGPWLFTEAGNYEIVMTVHTTVDGRQISLETNRVAFTIAENR